MPEPSTADLLRRAADRIEELAKAATPNICPDWIRWAVRHIARNCEIGCCHGDGQASDALNHDGWDRYTDAPWIAALGPQVAAPLAAWLRATALDAEMVDQQNDAARKRALRRNDHGQTFVVHRAEVGHAVAFARALLGETPTSVNRPVAGASVDGGDLRERFELSGGDAPGGVQTTGSGPEVGAGEAVVADAGGLVTGAVCAGQVGHVPSVPAAALARALLGDTPDTAAPPDTSGGAATPTTDDQGV